MSPIIGISAPYIKYDREADHARHRCTTQNNPDNDAAGSATHQRALMAALTEMPVLSVAPAPSAAADKSDGISRAAPPLATVPAARPPLLNTPTSSGRRLLGQPFRPSQGAVQA